MFNSLILLLYAQTIRNIKNYMVLQRKEKIFYITTKNSQQTKSKVKLYVFYN